MFNARKDNGAIGAGITFPEGVSHQAGAPRQYGDLVVLNECVKITQDIPINETIIELSYNVTYAYGFIYQMANGNITITPCVATQTKVFPTGKDVKISNGAYPVVIVTTCKA